MFVTTPSGMKRRNFNVGYRGETTRKEANKKRLELLAKANRGELCDSGGVTLAGRCQRSSWTAFAFGEGQHSGFLLPTRAPVPAIFTRASTVPFAGR